MEHIPGIQVFTSGPTCSQPALDEFCTFFLPPYVGTRYNDFDPIPLDANADKQNFSDKALYFLLEGSLKVDYGDSVVEVPAPPIETNQWNYYFDQFNYNTPCMIKTKGARLLTICTFRYDLRTNRVVKYTTLENSTISSDAVDNSLLFLYNRESDQANASLSVLGEASETYTLDPSTISLVRLKGSFSLTTSDKLSVFLVTENP